MTTNAPTRLIAITGKRGHGKTTAALVLERAGYRHINFADGVKEVVELVYGIPMEVLQHAVLKETMLDGYPNATPREVMQQVGTDMFRAYRDDTWVEMFKRRSGDYSHVVCSDLRFPNEADAVRALGGTIIKVVDPRKVRPAPTAAQALLAKIVPAWLARRIKLDLGDAAAAHASETSIDLIEADIEVDNDTTIEALQKQIADLLL